MPKLSDTQSILLTAAAQRADGNLLPLPGSLRGGAATKVVAALLARGLAEEQTVESTAQADPALNRSGAMPTTGAASCCGSRRPVSTPSASRPVAPRWRPWRQVWRRRRATGQRRRPGPCGRHVGPVGQDPRGHQAGAARRHARPRRGRHHRRDRRCDRLAAAHGARRLRRRAEEAARADVDSEKVEGRGRVYRIASYICRVACGPNRKRHRALSARESRADMIKSVLGGLLLGAPRLPARLLSVLRASRSACLASRRNDALRDARQPRPASAAFSSRAASRRPRPRFSRARTSFLSTAWPAPTLHPPTARPGQKGCFHAHPATWMGRTDTAHFIVSPGLAASEITEHTMISIELLGAIFSWAAWFTWHGRPSTGDG